jgi:microcin C transport system ATP-binding protein
MRKTVGHIKAVNAATLSIRAGETVGIVGESGSGKTTLALAIMRLLSSEGPIMFLGQQIQGRKSRDLRALRKDMQIVFQDPYGSLSPRMTIEQIIAEGLGVHGTDPGRGWVGSRDDASLSTRILGWPTPTHSYRPRDDPASKVGCAG